MKLLLDTHLAFWAALDPTELSVAESAMIALPDMQVALSAVSLWELRIKWNRHFVSGERKGPAHPEDVWTWFVGNGLPVLDLTAAGAVFDLDPPLAHSDPFDELLLAQAQQAGYRLLTRDDKLASHPVALRA